MDMLTQGMRRVSASRSPKSPHSAGGKPDWCYPNQPTKSRPCLPHWYRPSIAADTKEQPAPTCTPPSSDAVNTSFPEGEMTTFLIGPKWPLRAILCLPPACCRLGV